MVFKAIFGPKESLISVSSELYNNVSIIRFSDLIQQIFKGSYADDLEFTVYELENG